MQKREHIKEDFNKTKNQLVRLEQQQKPLFEQQQKFEHEIQQFTEQHKQCTEQLQHSSQFSPLDQGLNAHIQQLK